jgi:hypothetical protein
MPKPDQGIAGATCLPAFVEFLEGTTTTPGEPYWLRTRANTEYVLVHIYLGPAETPLRVEFRKQIDEELKKLQAIKLQDLAYAIPANRGNGAEIACATWDRLRDAGALGVDKESGSDAWRLGDVIYVHYVSRDNGLCVLAHAPSAGERLKDLPDDSGITF